MFSAVQAAQKQRSTVAGPPPPSMTSGVNVSAKMPTQLNGVEMQAAGGKFARPMINTAASDRVAKLGMMMPAPTPTLPGAEIGGVPADILPPASMSQAPAASPLGGMAAASPLGGMSAAPLSSRGGPMGYSPQGVGTTNPNSFAVGRNNKDFAARTNPMMVSTPNMMTARSAPMAMLSGPSSPRVAGPSMMPPPPPAGAPAGRDDAFWAGLKQQSADYQTQVQTERAATAESDAKAQADQLAREQMMQVTTTQIPGTDYIIPFAGSKAMGTLPIQKPDAPIPAGLVPQGAVRDGVQYGLAQTPQNTKLPAFTYEKDPNGSGKIIGAVYPKQDPQTGAWSLQRVDINGDGVVDAAEAAASGSAPAAAAQAPGQAVKTKGGNSYTLK